MDSALLGNLNGQERKEFKEYLLNNKKVLDILFKIWYNRLEGLESSSEQDYDSPSWAYKQAHLNGKKEVIQSLLKMLTIKDDQSP